MHEKAEIEDLREGLVYRYANSVAKRSSCTPKNKRVRIGESLAEESLALEGRVVPAVEFCPSLRPRGERISSRQSLSALL